jgi:protoporphyrinogen oxidase
MEKRIVIIGAGPCGLGAAYRLKELGYRNWAVFEEEPHIGGLSASVKDRQGFVWDKGGHVIFSHFKYFDDIIRKLLGTEFIEHQRKAYIYSFDRWIPYPFQNNIRYLPVKELLECILGLTEAQSRKNDPRHFKDWILYTFGDGIAKYFLIPQNLKTWGYPLEYISKDWIGERVSVIDIKRILKNIIADKDDVSWGPNNKFKFPLYGGTGGLFNKFQPIIKEKLFLRKKAVGINIKKRQILFADGSKDNYDILINTSSLDQFIRMMEPRQKALSCASGSLKYSGSYVVGVGLKGRCTSTKCWMYFPEDKTPCYRITYFSNYSRHNVPDHSLYWSLLCETSYSRYKKVTKSNIIEDTINGLIATKLISKSDKKNIVSTQLIDIKYSYPIPTLKRDNALQLINASLEKNMIYSRGRFGAWKYECGNMDHSLMQGVNIVERIVLGKK